MSLPPKIAVIGAGLAGLACARALLDAGTRVEIFEKSRGVGGRLATRRPFGMDSAVGLDHGAPVAEAEEEAGLARLAELGSPWAPNGGLSLGIVGCPGMSDLVKPLAQGARVHLSCEITDIARGEDEGDWLLRDREGALLGPFDAVVSAVPAPQALALLGDSVPDCSAAQMAPCWTLLLVLAEPLGLPLDLLRPEGDPFDLIIRNSSKPDRSAPMNADAREEGDLGARGETWVAHSSADWAAAHLETNKDEMAQTLFAAFVQATGQEPGTVLYKAAHRWRYARTSAPVGRAFHLSEDGTLGVCGDWRLGPLAGHALRSGTLLGGAMAKKLLG
ncbi:MAG: FAD-dependent oxidoreductase [Neomegalonema sp.]|nr:FAD-dependent oxidoreductase [Neomegalonema sp.]